MSASQNFFGSSARTKIRQGYVRVPVVVTIQGALSLTLIHRPPDGSSLSSVQFAPVSALNVAFGSPAKSESNLTPATVPVVLTPDESYQDGMEVLSVAQ